MVSCYCSAYVEVNVGFAEMEVVVDEPSNITVSVVLFENNLDPGTFVNVNLMSVDDVARGT